MRKLLVAIAALVMVSCSNYPKSAADVELDQQIEAAEALVGRVTAGRQGEFVVNIVPEQVDGKDWFAYYAKDGKVVLEGNDGVSVASALNHYLKENCGWHLTWCGKQDVLPEVLPLPQDKV